MSSIPKRLIRFNAHITIPQMTALEKLADTEGKHMAELLRAALDVYFETKGIRVGGRDRHTAMLSKRRQGYKANRATTRANKAALEGEIR